MRKGGIGHRLRRWADVQGVCAGEAAAENSHKNRIDKVISVAKAVYFDRFGSCSSSLEAGCFYFTKF